VHATISVSENPVGSAELDKFGEFVMIDDGREPHEISDQRWSYSTTMILSAPRILCRLRVGS
jgi:hypothetical protein